MSKNCSFDGWSFLRTLRKPVLVSLSCFSGLISWFFTQPTYIFCERNVTEAVHVLLDNPVLCISYFNWHLLEHRQCKFWLNQVHEIVAFHYFLCWKLFIFSLGKLISFINSLILATQTNHTNQVFPSLSPPRQQKCFNSIMENYIKYLTANKLLIATR